MAYKNVKITIMINALMLKLGLVANNCRETEIAFSWSAPLFSR